MASVMKWLKRLSLAIIVLLAALFIWWDAGNWEARVVLQRLAWRGSIPAADLTNDWDRVCAVGPYGSGFREPEVQIDGTGLAFFLGDQLVHFIQFQRIIEEPWGPRSCLPASSTPFLQRLMRRSKITNQEEPLLFLRPKSELLDDLPPSIEMASEEFQRRVEAAFLSVPNAEVFYEKLALTGFSVQPERNSAFLETASNVCHFVHNIVWSIDANGGLSDIRAYRTPQCL